MKYENKVKVQGCDINVYTEGSGEVTVVFIAGNGVTAPALEYKPLYSRMAAHCRIAVIDRPGSGFSSDKTSDRKVDNMVEEDREALRLAGIEPPYVLAAHSLGGFEAVWWANTYPGEVSAVLGVDMGVPEYGIEQGKDIPDGKRIAMVRRQAKLMNIIAKDGLLARLFRNSAENSSGLLTGSELSEEEKKLYRELFYKNIARPETSEQAELIPENAGKAHDTGNLGCRCCMYISDMKVPGMKTTWRQAGITFAERCGAEYHLSDKGHMMYTKIPGEMAETFLNFLRTQGILGSE